MAGEDNEIRIIDVADAKEIKSWKGPDASIHALEYVPSNGNLLVSASADKMAKLWNVNEGKAIRDFAGHTGAVLALAVSRDGKRLATGSADATVKLWNVADGKLVATLAQHAGPVTSVALSPDAARLASGSADHTVRLWDATKATELQELSAPDSLIAGVAFTPDDKSVVAARATRRCASGRRPRSASSPDTRGRSSAWPFSPTEPRLSPPRPTRRSRSSTSPPAT